MKNESQPLFSKGQRIRAYDYDPGDVEGKEVFIEGVIQDIVTHPYHAYQVLCERCTGYGRAGKLISVPIEVACNEFNGRIVLSPAKD